MTRAGPSFPCEKGWLNIFVSPGDLKFEAPPGVRNLVAVAGIYEGYRAGAEPFLKLDRDLRLCVVTSSVGVAACFRCLC